MAVRVRRYVFFRPDVGYVQGMSHLAAMLLLNLDVFPAFVAFANLLQVTACPARAPPKGFGRVVAFALTRADAICAVRVSARLIGCVLRGITFFRSSGWTCARSASASTRSTACWSTTSREYTPGRAHETPTGRLRSTLRAVGTARMRTRREPPKPDIRERRFQQLEINPNMYLLNWLMALYTKSLPLDLVALPLVWSRHQCQPPAGWSFANHARMDLCASLMRVACHAPLQCPAKEVRSGTLRASQPC
jgi:hypothetical protein